MNAQHKQFHDRVNRIERKARAMDAGGSEATLRKDGLIELRPARKPLRRFVPIRLLLAMVAGGILYKVFLLTRLGEAAYAAKLTALADGTTVNQIGATLMQIDPVTRMLTDLVAPYLG